MSAVSAWEISIKKALGKLQAPDDLEQALAMNCFQALPVSIKHALGVSLLPTHHDDPFDRLLVAQAQLEDLTLITADPKLHFYDVKFIDNSCS